MKKLMLGLITCITLLVIALQWSEGALAPVRQKKIGVLVASDLRMSKVSGLQEGLPHYNLTPNQNVSLILKNARDDLSELPRLAQELVNENVDVIVTTGTFETFTAKEALGERKTPVVFIGVGCSVEMGLVRDTVNPGCNITGVDSHYVQLSGKRLEYLKRLAPSIKQVMVLYNPLSTPIGPSAVYLYEAADKLNVQLNLQQATTPAEVREILAKSQLEGNDAVMLMCSLLFEQMTEELAQWGKNQGIPVMGVSEQQTEKGLLASYGLPYKEEGRQAARIVSNVLRKKDPADIPIESPAKLDFYLNVETAKSIGIPLNRPQLPFVTQYIEGARGQEREKY